MKKYIVIFVATISLTLFSCEDRNTNVWYSYNETQCADPWATGFGNDEAQVKSEVEEYLENLGVVVAEVDMNNNGVVAVCLACSCTSGRIIRVRSTEDAEDTMTAEGFSRE